MKSTAKSDRDWRLHPGVEPSPDSGASQSASSLAERPGANGPFWKWRGGSSDGLGLERPG